MAHLKLTQSFRQCSTANYSLLFNATSLLFSLFCNMIKKISLTFILCAILGSCYQPERDCEKYKTGSFKFTYEIGDTIKEGKFIRTEDYSIDYYENKIDSATVRWFNDCEFVLQDLNSKTALQYKIISTTDSSYTFQYKSAVKDPNKKLIVKTGTAIKTN